jgi:transcriptional regulator with XRE-family HTH domain
MHLSSRPRLRLWRRGHALKQKELASLIGIKSLAHVSRIERGIRTPTIEIAIACEILSGQSMRDLFPDTYQAIERETLIRAQRLLDKVEISSTQSSQRKRQWVGEMLERVRGGRKQPTIHVEQRN